MRRVVVESPYAGPTSGDVEANVEYARRCVKDCLARGEAPYASHLFFTQPGVLDDTRPEERTLGMEAGFEWGSVAAATVVYIDRGISKGMWQGIKRAMATARRIEFRALDPVDGSNPFHVFLG